MRALVLNIRSIKVRRRQQAESIEKNSL